MAESVVMTRQEHYEEAERLLTQVDAERIRYKEGGFTEIVAQCAADRVVARAQVHATLSNTPEFHGTPPGYG